jgi:hypothetical protein
MELAKKYISVLVSRGFIVTVGTEHNTPKMESMIPGFRGGVEPDDDLKGIFWQGAKVVAAHQYLTYKGQSGYVDSQGNKTDKDISQLESVGESVIAYYLNEVI